MMLENAIEMLRSHLLANAQFATDLASITEKTYQARGYAVDSTTLNDYHARKPAERVESALLNEPVKQKDIESYLLKREQETRNIKDYIDIYLYGVKQPQNRYEVLVDGNNIIVTFVADVTRLPNEVSANDFEIKGKIAEIE